MIIRDILLTILILDVSCTAFGLMSLSQPYNENNQEYV